MTQHLISYEYKTDAVVIRDETTTGANTATRIGTNLVAIADDLVAKQSAIDLNTAKVGITPTQASDIIANNAKISYTDAAKVSNITVTQAVNLDTMESNISTNSAKISFDVASSTRLANTSGTNTGDQDISGIATNASAIAGKQDILLEGAFVDGDKTKLDSIAAGATPDQDLSGKQDVLVSATNIKTINGNSVLGAGDLTVTGVLKYSETFGNGSLTTIPITHLLGTNDYTYRIKEISTGGTIDAEVVDVDANNLNIIFAVAPTTNQYRITIIA